MRGIVQLTDLVAWQMCLGCGACASVCPENAIELVNFLDEGIRPKIKKSNCGTCQDCLQVCPAYSNDRTGIQCQTDIVQSLLPAWGPVLEIWEGHATDPEIRYLGSSGGLLTALSLYCLEAAGMHGVLHIGQDHADPLSNRTYLSRTRAELLSRTGSRYAPASTCDRLRELTSAPAKCVFIGQPSEVAAMRKVAQAKPEIGEKIGLALSFFCAGSPPARATLELIKKLGLNANAVNDLRYRGKGWPGMFAVSVNGQNKPAREITYKESWRFLQSYRPYSVHLWPDGTGELADISCGDAWHREPQSGGAGSSLVLVRTEKGKKFLHDAMAAGYVQLQPATPEMLKKATQGLIDKKRSIWGRQLAMRLLGIPTTRYRGMPLFKLWLELPVKEKLRSIFGTMRRIIQRKYYRPMNL